MKKKEGKANKEKKAKTKKHAPAGSEGGFARVTGSHSGVPAVRNYRGTDKTEIQAPGVIARSDDPAYAPPAGREETAVPEKYGDNKVVLMARDPYWCYAFWDISDALLEEKKKVVLPEWGKACLCMRVYDVTGAGPGRDGAKYQDIYINGIIGNWYINIWSPSRVYQAVIGLKTTDGHFTAMAESNMIETPADSASADPSEDWMDADDNFREIFRLSGGQPLGASENMQGSRDFFTNNGRNNGHS